MDHLILIARDGRSTHGNVVPACKECNNKKKCLLPTEWKEYLESLKKGRGKSTKKAEILNYAYPVKTSLRIISIFFFANTLNSLSGAVLKVAAPTGKRRKKGNCN